MLGKNLFGKLMKGTFYGHFVGGADGIELKPIVEQLRNNGITGMVTYSAEEDLSGEKNVPKKDLTDNATNSKKENIYYNPCEPKCDINTKVTLDAINTAAGTTLFTRFFLIYYI